jgi:hypothetical protein
LGGPVRYPNEKEKWIYSLSEKYLSRQATGRNRLLSSAFAFVDSPQQEKRGKGKGAYAKSLKECGNNFWLHMATAIIWSNRQENDLRFLHNYVYFI